MENVNFSLTANNKLNKQTHFYNKLDNLLKACKDMRTDISHVYLDNEDTIRIMRSVKMAAFYDAKFNELGITLVFSAPQREAQ